MRITIEQAEQKAHFVSRHEVKRLCNRYLVRWSEFEEVYGRWNEYAALDVIGFFRLDSVNTSERG